MLPAGQSDAARDIALLQQAPFMQKVVINLKAEPHIDRKTLTETADKLAGALKKPYYDRVITGPQMPSPEVFFPLASGGRPGAYDREGSAGNQGRSSSPRHPVQTSNRSGAG